jgi:hypothetical protein
MQKRKSKKRKKQFTLFAARESGPSLLLRHLAFREAGSSGEHTL